VSAGRLERTIRIVLQAGIATSSACLAVGLFLSFAGLAPALSLVLLDAGLLVLIATPGARVVVSVAEYIAERDWTFTVLTTLVLLELLASVVAAAWR
jgi:uncharacterized membrane protein